MKRVAHPAVTAPPGRADLLDAAWRWQAIGSDNAN